MNYSVILHGKNIKIFLTPRAEKALGKRDVPITAVVHLIFGCMVAKRVWFREQVDAATIRVTESLSLSFDVVRYANCSLRNIDGGGEPERFPLGKDIRDFVPDLLEIDYHKREFTGGFTYQRIPSVLSSAANEPDALPANCVPGSTG
jgi:hypothetical protein